ncbi:hypothetical protein P3T35_001862 [Kitasatospora sp. GP30]|nr:hypothetical protein [Kitasatospora sp. GP30]
MHDFSNMIALCPTCHARFDRGQIDRPAMRDYKAGLRRSMERIQLLDAYRSLQTAIDLWVTSVTAIELADVAEDPDLLRSELVAACGLNAGQVQHALTGLREVTAEEVSWQAGVLCHWVKYWADDVVDGRWPSTHAGATQHDVGELAEIEQELHRVVCGQLGLQVDDLPQRIDRKAKGSPLSLGGTGKLY